MSLRFEGDETKSESGGCSTLFCCPFSKEQHFLYSARVESHRLYLFCHSVMPDEGAKRKKGQGRALSLECICWDIWMAVRSADTPYFNSAHGHPCCMLSKRQGGGGENRVFRPDGRAGRKFARILRVGETQDDGESGDSAFFLAGSAGGRAHDAVGRAGGGGGYACNLSGGCCMRRRSG